VKNLRALVVGALFLASAGGCSGTPKPAPESTAGTAPATTPAPAPAPPGEAPFKAVPGATLAQLTLDQLAELQKSTPLSEWKAAHADDVVSPYHAQHAEPSLNDWCARAIGQVVVDGDRTMRRTAYFYPPPTPDSLSVPAETPEKLVDQCQLGLVWIETADMSGRVASLTATDASQAITDNLGAATTPAISWWGAAAWKQKARWTVSDVSVVMGSTDQLPWKVERETKPMRVIAAAAGPASGINFLMPSATASESTALARKLTAERLDEAIKLADRDDSLERPIRDYTELFTGTESEPRILTPAERTAFVDALGEWVTFTPEYPAQRRVAALAAADLLLDASRSKAGWADKKQTALRRSLQAKGATFADDKLGNTVVYTHSWLKTAERMNAGGRASELAFTALMSMGFETSGMCLDQGPNGFQEVIRRGEEFLRTHPNASTITDVHVLIARAYADIVALADGSGGEYADADTFKADVDRARSRALGEFQSALQSDSSSPQIRALWPAIWRVAAGIAPTQTRFFCVYD
jgi:hypothetical protein